MCTELFNFSFQKPSQNTWLKFSPHKLNVLLVLPIPLGPEFAIQQYLIAIICLTNLYNVLLVARLPYTCNSKQLKI